VFFGHANAVLPPGRSAIASATAFVLVVATDGGELVLQVCEFLIKVGGYCAEIGAG
jgi:hypothetical protein